MDKRVTLEFQSVEDAEDFVTLVRLDNRIYVRPSIFSEEQYAFVEVVPE